MVKTFEKQDKSFQRRYERYQRIAQTFSLLHQYPDKVPVVVEPLYNSIPITKFSWCLMSRRQRTPWLQNQLKHQMKQALRKIYEQQGNIFINGKDLVLLSQEPFTNNLSFRLRFYLKKQVKGEVFYQRFQQNLSFGEMYDRYKENDGILYVKYDIIIIQN